MICPGNTRPLNGLVDPAQRTKSTMMPVAQGLSEIPGTIDVESWGILTAGPRFPPYGTRLGTHLTCGAGP
jgi:hypothetical protein